MSQLNSSAAVVVVIVVPLGSEALVVELSASKEPLVDDGSDTFTFRTGVGSPADPAFESESDTDGGGFAAGGLTVGNFVTCGGSDGRGGAAAGGVRGTDGALVVASDDDGDVGLELGVTPVGEDSSGGSPTSDGGVSSVVDGFVLGGDSAAVSLPALMRRRSSVVVVAGFVGGNDGGLGAVLGAEPLPLESAVGGLGATVDGGSGLDGGGSCGVVGGAG